MKACLKIFFPPPVLAAGPGVILDGRVNPQTVPNLK
jgi:hypothetical protein